MKRSSRNIIGQTPSARYGLIRKHKWQPGAAIRLLIITVLLGAWMESSQAARVSTTENPGCAIVLTGTIEQGDFARLRDAARDRGLLKPADTGEPSNPQDQAVCLDSPGGSYVEGRLIAGLVHEFGITTRVPSQAECLSACAFIFMAGRAHGAETDGPSRFLNVRAKLGFHAPYLALQDDDVLSGRDTMAILELHNKIIGEFIQFGSYASDFDARPMFSLSLLGETLSAGPTELAGVDTIEAAARWGIFLEGVAAGRPIDHKAAAQICVNFQAWMVDKRSDSSSMDYYKSQPITVEHAELWGEEVELARIDTGGMEERYCLVRLSTQPTSGTAICSRDDFNGLNFGDCRAGVAHWVPWYYSLPPETPISAIAE